MTIPRRCGVRATHFFMPYKIPACPDHVRWNQQKGLTYAPRSGPMIGAGVGSRYEPI